MPRMRRRLRSAALPIHRHALPQVALDAGLVALAYYLAYRLRFDGGIPPVYLDLFGRTIAFAIIGSLACFAVVGMYRHWMRYSSQREYVKIAEGVVLAVLALVGYVTVVQPKLVSAPTGFVSIGVPSGVLALFGLLSGAFLTGTRFLVHLVYQRPLRGFREFIIDLTSFIKHQEVGGMFTATTPTLFGGESITEAHISTLTDSIILLRYVELYGEMRRGITVLKMRGSMHDKDIREFTIDGEGMHIARPFRSVTGILAGHPVYAEPSEIQRMGELFGERTQG